MKSRKEPPFPALAVMLADVGRHFYRRGWALGTSGNFSAVVSRQPLRLAITANGRDKGRLTAGEIVQVDGDGKLVKESSARLRGGVPRASARGPRRSRAEDPENPVSMRPSDESRLHLAIVRARHAGAVLHTHSVWSTLLSEAHVAKGGLAIEGYEMLKGLDGIPTHEHREWLPIVENSQDMGALAGAVEEVLARHPSAHGFLVGGHGLYTWGRDLSVAKRHIEILEFLLEVVARKTAFENRGLGSALRDWA
jgi:methylthioribulose-1-phosphate dehydratase